MRQGKLCSASKMMRMMIETLLICWRRLWDQRYHLQLHFLHPCRMRRFGAADVREVADEVADEVLLLEPGQQPQKQLQQAGIQLHGLP
jgi:hypothetical protein